MTPGLLNSANFLFQIFNAIGQALYSNFQHFYVLPYIRFPYRQIISLTRTLVGWSDVRSLITAAFQRSRHFGQGFSPTLPRGLGLGSRL